MALINYMVDKDLYKQLKQIHLRFYGELKRDVTAYKKARLDDVVKFCDMKKASELLNASNA